MAEILRGLEVLLLLQRPFDRPVHRGERPYLVIVQLRIWGVQAVDPAGRLLHDLVAVVERVEDHHVGRDAVPPLAPGAVLHQVDPPVRVRKLVVPVSVPLVHRDAGGLLQSPQLIEFGVEVVEYDHPLELPAQVGRLPEPLGIRVDDPPEAHHHLGRVADRLVLEGVPPVAEHRLVGRLVVSHGHVVEHPFRSLGALHGDEHGPAALAQPVLVHPPVDLGELAPPGIYDVMALELGAVLVEAVGDEHRRVVHPRIARRRGQQDPLVRLGDLQEALDPRAGSDQTLLVEDEEASGEPVVLVHVVPRVDGDGHPAHGLVASDVEVEPQQFVLPLPGVALLGRGDDDQVRRALQRLVGVAELVQPVPGPADPPEIERQGGDRLARSDASAQDAPGSELEDRLLLEFEQGHGVHVKVTSL